MKHLLHASLLALCLLASAACAGTSSGYIPVDSPLIEHEPPDPEELIEDDTGDDDDDSSSSDEDSTQGSEAAAPAAAAPAAPEAKNPAAR